MADPQPFKISVPNSEIESLKSKLISTRFPDELEDADWAYGVPLTDMKRLVHHWINSYDWRKHESDMNDSIPQFVRDIEVAGHGTLNIHFVHQTSKVTQAIPLLFVHGWPGHFLEVSKILPLLTQPSDSDSPAFHVVALSLPGYAFSAAPKTMGFGIPMYAEVAHKLMLSLGYNAYVVQGGDWGSVIGRTIAKTYGPSNCKAFHTNMVAGQPPKLSRDPILWLKDKTSSYSPEEKAGLARGKWFQIKGRGYFMEQSTQPQTLAYFLADSPVGLLSWIYEKLHNWTDSHDFTDDEILTWVSLYWFSKSGPAASVRIYYEFVHGPQDNSPVNNIPLGLSVFPKDIFYTPKTWRPTLGNVVFDSVHDSGGHFAAYEKPNELVDDLRAMFGKKGPAFGVTKGTSGYPAA